MTELDSARTLHSGSLDRFGDAVVKLRNIENEFEKLRFLEFRSGSTAGRDALLRGANKPEGSARSAWNEIAIPIANSGFPSIPRRFNPTFICVDWMEAIGVAGDCENPRKLIYCAASRDDFLGNPGPFAK
jgi:hypothetical protein